jgi:hypothetical protein
MAVVSRLNTTLPSTTIIQTPHHPSIPTNMSSILCKLKTTILNHLKSLPEAHITEDANFKVWSHKFVATAVSPLCTNGG